MNNLKEIIKSSRENKKMSKSELARNINVSPSYITMLENGEKTNPSLEILTKISSVLDIPLDKLLLKTEKPKSAFNLEAIISTHKSRKRSQFNMMELVEPKPKGYFLKQYFSVDIDSLTDAQIDELLNSLKFTISLKLEEFKNKNK